MFYEVKGGTTENIQGLTCWIPPVGMIWDPLASNGAGRWVKVGVYRRDQTHFANCYWEPDPRWKKYRKWAAEEKERRKIDHKFTHNELRRFIEEMWRFRLGGFWYYNNNKPTYITGQHWYYMSVYHLDIGLPRYRNVDRQFFYAWEWVKENPYYYGLVEVTKRRSGKTFRAGCILIEETSRSIQFMSGIQSKNDKDARKVFNKAIIGPYRKLPYFFMVTDNMSKFNKKTKEWERTGKPPANELKFTSDSAVYEEDSELESMIDYQPSGELAYDGQKVKRYFGDEVGKTKDVDVYERHGVVKPAMTDDRRRVIGKMIYTTTVEEMDSGGRAFTRFWKASDHRKAIAAGKKTTPSGLARLFFAAQESGSEETEDIYGNVDQEAEKKAILEDREGLDSRARAAHQRKYPTNENEAFQIDATSCIFNPTLLNNRENTLEGVKDAAYMRGNLHWEGGIRDGKVIFKEDNENGRFKFRWMPPEHLQNRKIVRGPLTLPGNAETGAIGVDPYDMRILEEDGEYSMSMGAIAGILRPDPLADPKDHPLPLGGPAFIYLARPDNPETMWEDALKASVFYGWPALIENNKPGCVQYFEDRGYAEYAYKIQGQTKRGIAAAARTKGGGTNAAIAEHISIFIEEYSDTIWFMELIEQFKRFTPMDTTEFDLAMAFGYALLLLRRTMAKPKKETKGIPIKSLWGFAKKKHRGLRATDHQWT